MISLSDSIFTDTPTNIRELIFHTPSFVFFICVLWFFWHPLLFLSDGYMVQIKFILIRDMLDNIYSKVDLLSSARQRPTWKNSNHGVHVAAVTAAMTVMTTTTRTRMTTAVATKTMKTTTAAMSAVAARQQRWRAGTQTTIN